MVIPDYVAFQVKQTSYCEVFEFPRATLCRCISLADTSKLDLSRKHRIDSATCNEADRDLRIRLMRCVYIIARIHNYSVVMNADLP